MNLLSFSVAQLKRAITIKEQIESLESELAGLVAPVKVTTPPAKKKVISRSARAKTSAAQTARWAKLKDAKTPAAPKKKRKLSPQGRANIVAAVKARWAAKK